MATCPACQAQIEIGSEFFGGLFTCPQCQAVYFIGFDGTPESVPSKEENVNQSYSQAENNSSTTDQFEEVPFNLPPLPSENYQTENQNNLGAENFPQAPTYEYQPDQAPNSETAEVMAPVFSPLQDVVEFANSEESKSLSSYTVTILNLDSASNLQALREVLSDSKLKMNFEQIKSQIKHGTLKLEKLDPAQAAVIAFRLRPYPLEMKWEQSLQ